MSAVCGKRSVAATMMRILNLSVQRSMQTMQCKCECVRVENNKNKIKCANKKIAGKMLWHVGCVCVCVCGNYMLSYYRRKHATDGVERR